MTKNIHALNLKGVMESLPPLEQPPPPPVDDADELINILPSYLMYHSTVGKNLTPRPEDRRQDPPSYELTPQLSVGSQSSLERRHRLVDDPDDYVTGGNADEQSLLANVFKLPRLHHSNKSISLLVSIDIVFTEHIGKVGIPPKIIDPLTKEWRQGDFIYGYVLVTNHAEEPIPFDVFAVQFDGVEMLYDDKSNPYIPLTHESLCSMFDFNALWNEGFLDRLLSEDNNPYHKSLVGKDPVDNTFVYLDSHKVFVPHVTYKKFFAFRLPDRCLDSVCRHGIDSHLQLPPTLGTCKHERMLVLRDPNRRYLNLGNDLATEDALVAYHLSARIIGPFTDYADYATTKSKGPDNQYVIFNEVHAYIRVVPLPNPGFELNRALIAEELRILYNQLLRDVKDAINAGRLVAEPQRRPPSNFALPLGSPHTERPSLLPTTSSVDVAKIQQAYYSSPQPTVKPKEFRVFYPVKKQLVFHKSKVVGLASFLTPRVDHRVSYIPALPNSPHGPTKVDIPLTLEFISHDGKAGGQVPDFRRVLVEIVALTVRSKRNPIPVDIVPEMMFNDKGKSTENFDMLTIKRFQGYATELSRLMRESGDEFHISLELLANVKAMANLAAKYHTLKVDTITLTDNDGLVVPHIGNIPWTSAAEGANQTRYLKKFHLNFDIRRAKLVSADGKELAGPFHLVPDFQSCLLARLYYIRIKFKMPNGEKVCLQVPLLIQRNDE